jgi:ribokinase
MKPIVVIGSSNTDMVVKAAKLPEPGETVLGGSFLMTPGGKGANQAMAAQRLAAQEIGNGNKVFFVASIGDDIFGQQALQGFEAEGLDSRFVVRAPGVPSGIALIGVDERGENSILVAPGANANLLPENVSKALEAIPEAEWMLLQLEIPMETVTHSVWEGARRGLKVVLNPAPAGDIPEELFSSLYLITPNETEAELLTGVSVVDEDSAWKAARILHEKGVRNVVITLGVRGALLFSAGKQCIIPAPRVVPLDTTAAGDIFNGALVVALAEQKHLPEAMDFACRAAALSVMRLGAQASIPTRQEVDEWVPELS